MSEGRRRTLVIVLICSIAINLLLIGGLVGHFATTPPGRPFPSHLGWIVRELDDDTRQKLWPLLKQNAEEARPLRRDLGLAQREFEKALQADPFDEEQVLLALDKLQKTARENQTRLHLQMIGVMKEMNPQDRAKALRFLHKRDAGAPGRRGRRP
jgi:uncharacterized membrane protein